MPRKQSPTPVFDTQSVDPQLEQDFQSAAELGQQMTVVDSSYGDSLPYDRNRIVNEMRFFMANATQAILEVGKRLVLIKQHESPEAFKQLMIDMNLEERLVRRVIQATAKCNRLGPSKAQKLLGLSQVKFFELMVLDDEDLAELADGGSVADLCLDDIDCMPSTELRASLRRARESSKQQQETFEQLLVAKDQKLNALDRELMERSRSGAVKAWPEQVSAMNLELATLSHVATESIAHLHSWNQALAIMEVPDVAIEQDDPRRALVLALHDTASRLASLVGSLQHALFDEYPLILSQPTFDLKVAAE